MFIVTEYAALNNNNAHGYNYKIFNKDFVILAYEYNNNNNNNNNNNKIWHRNLFNILAHSCIKEFS